MCNMISTTLMCIGSRYSGILYLHQYTYTRNMYYVGNKSIVTCDKLISKYSNVYRYQLLHCSINQWSGEFNQNHEASTAWGCGFDTLNPSVDKVKKKSVSLLIPFRKIKSLTLHLVKVLIPTYLYEEEKHIHLTHCGPPRVLD